MVEIKTLKDESAAPRIDNTNPRKRRLKRERMKQIRDIISNLNTSASLVPDVNYGFRNGSPMNALLKADRSTPKIQE